MKHFILENAHKYNEPLTDPAPNGASFNDEAGYWTDNITGDAIVTNDGFRDMNTKKADRETGEDQKGE